MKIVPITNLTLFCSQSFRYMCRILWRLISNIKSNKFISAIAPICLDALTDLRQLSKAGVGSLQYLCEIDSYLIQR